MSHPILPDREDTHDVFNELLATLPDDKQGYWLGRWREARRIERRRRDYDREYDRSLASVSWGGQGGS